MHDKSLKVRLDRLISGERRTDDLDRLFLAMREKAPQFETVREIGDFIAHQDQRNRGAIVIRLGLLLVSFRNWTYTVQGMVPSLERIEEAGRANLDLATDPQLRANIRMGHDRARRLFDRGLQKLRQGKRPSATEERVINFLGGHFVWNVAFDGASLFRQFEAALLSTQLLERDQVKGSADLHDFVCLYVLTLLHGTRVALEDGARLELFASFENSRAELEIRAELVVLDHAKPMGAAPSLFSTGLTASEHCDADLLAAGSRISAPIEVSAEGKLILMSSQSSRTEA